MDRLRASLGPTVAPILARGDAGGVASTSDRTAAEAALIEADARRARRASRSVDAWADAATTLAGARQPVPASPTPAGTRPRRGSPTATAPAPRSRSREARAIAPALGARPLLAVVEALAARARLVARRRRTAADAGGGRRSAAAPADPFGLTARERDVLPLLVQGRTNRQIAETLFISESTAGVHVSNILGKLGATSRTEAATIAVRLRLDRPTSRREAVRAGRA